MQNDQEHIEQLLPGYFNGILTEADKATVEIWKNLSQQNQEIFSQSEKVWQSLHLLSEMKRYKPQKALQQVNRKINQSTSQRWWNLWQKVAAIMVIPLLVTAVWLSLSKTRTDLIVESPTWQTFSTPPGVKSMFYLPDSTVVWLNSSSSISFPSYFTGRFRQVDAQGEVFFDVRKNTGQPFIVSLGKIHARVLGTRFNVINYDSEDRTEIILQSGKIELCTGAYDQPRSLSVLNPGELAHYNKSANTVNILTVDTDKYVAWIDGKLIFKDDPMEEVIRKFNRWFNVQIEVADKAILEYVYTATFQDESIDQILELLSLSAPIKYQIIRREKLNDNTFNAKRILLSKRKQI
jgi:ferric-dicitrate binding protein FerR (iron transport regulator)